MLRCIRLSSALRSTGALTAAMFVLGITQAAHAQTTIYSDSFDDASTGGTRTSRNTSTVPGAKPFYLALGSTSTGTALTATTPIDGTGSLSIASGMAVAANIGTQDFSVVGESYTLTGTFQFPTGTPALSTFRFGLLSTTGATADQNESSMGVTGLFDRVVTTTTGAGGSGSSNFDGVYYEPNTSASVLGGSNITGTAATYTDATHNNFVAGALGGSLANNVVRIQETVTRTSTGVTETLSYAPNASGGSFTQTVTGTFTNATLGTSMNSFNAIGILNSGAGVNLYADNINLTFTPAAAAPEPGALGLMMVAGLPVAGGLLRRRRRHVA